MPDFSGIKMRPDVLFNLVKGILADHVPDNTGSGYLEALYDLFSDMLLRGPIGEIDVGHLRERSIRPR